MRVRICTSARSNRCQELSQKIVGCRNVLVVGSAYLVLFIMLAEFNIDDGLPLSGPWHMLNLLSFSAFSKNSNSLQGSGSGSTITPQIYMEFINLFPPCLGDNI